MRFSRIVSLLVFAVVTSLAAAMPAGAQDFNTPRRLMQLLQQQFGIPVPPICAESDTSVGTSAVRVGLNDPASFEVILYNLGGANCYRSGLPGVTTTTGQFFAASGGYLEFDFRTDGVIPAQEQWVVCSGAANNIHMQRCDLQ